MAMTLENMADLCRQINDNWHKDGNRNAWKNLQLVPLAAQELRNMPRIEGETDAKNQIEVLSLMLDCVDELAIPRQALAIRKYQLSLFNEIKEEENPPEEITKEEVEKEVERLEDYLDLDFPMEEWCKKYHKHLLFDPVERTLEWELNIYEAEEAVAEIMADTPRGMGFCFGYWAALRGEMEKRGIEWKSPHIMNPRVLFD